MSSDIWGHSGQETIVDVLKRVVERAGNKPFIDFSGEGYTFAAFDRKSDDIARGLHALGLRKGEGVAWVLDNHSDAVFLLFGAIKTGVFNAPINTALKGDFLVHQINDSGASVIICESDYAQRVLNVEDELTNVTTLLYRGDAPSGVSKKLKILPFESLKVTEGEMPAVDLLPTDIFTLIYTSGTTGPSKGCMISHGYALNMARQCNLMSDMSEDDVLWTPLPLFHLNAIASSILAAIIGCYQVSIYSRFSVTNFWPEIERTKATCASLLGAMGSLIGHAPDTDVMKRCFGQLRVGGSAPMSPELERTWKERFGVKYANAMAYGLTEAACVTWTDVSQNPPPGSSGRRCEDFDVRIVDDMGRELPPGQPGEIIIRPLKPNVMFNGYLNRPESTLSMIKDLWFHSGDIGMFDADGWFYFVDRKKDYLRRRGENISSFEMESTFFKHPSILDVAVHAVYSEFSEDDVKLTATLRPDGPPLTEEELCRWAIDRVPYYAVPRYYEFRDDLPRNSSGRVLKYELRDQGVTPTTFDMEKAGIKIQRR